VPQYRLVVAMMHIPLVKSTPWLEPKRERLFRILESRDHCISLSGHTHHHEHVMIGEEDGWQRPQPHHHIINVTVSGSWWSGEKDEHGIPHTMCADGTPNGYTIMHFDGQEYLLEYRAARRDPDFQINVIADEVVAVGNVSDATFHANVFNAMPGADVKWRLNEEDNWRPMEKVVTQDPLFLKRWMEEQFGRQTLPWRPLPKPRKSPHLWQASLPANLPVGTHAIHVRATNPNGQTLRGHRILRVE